MGAGSEDAILRRTRFVDLWGLLPPLTVLAALPGWGKTTWMRQCAEHLRIAAPDTAVRWVLWRGALEELLRSTPDPTPTVYFVDDLLAAYNDPVWQQILEFTQQHRTQRFVVSSLDRPRLPPAAGAGCIVLDERNLRFSDEELTRLSELISANATADKGGPIPALYLGCPVLVHRYVRRFLDRRGHSDWPTPEPAPEVLLIRLFELERRSGGLEGSVLAAAMYTGRCLRRITADLITASPPDQLELDSQLLRLRAVPAFVEVHDDERGLESFAWTTIAWNSLRSYETPEQRKEALSRGLQQVRASGRVAAQLFYLLAMDRLAEAEALVVGDFRRLILFGGQRSADLLRNTPLDPNTHPGLTILNSILGTSQLGTSAATRRTVAAAIKVLRTAPGLTRDEELARSGLISYAAIFSGNRKVLTRYVKHILQFIETLESHPGVHRRRTNGNLFLGFRAAVQGDFHEAALRIVTAMGQFAQADDPLHWLETISLHTQQDLAGIRSLPDYVGPTDPSHAAALRDLERGDDLAALAATRELGTYSSPMMPRSAIDGLILSTQALCNPGALHIDEVGEAVEMNREHWGGQPSSFIAWAAMTAYAALGALPQAEALMNSLEDRPTVVLHRMTTIQWLYLDGRYDEMVQACLEVATGMPRFRVLTEVFHAAALLHLGRTSQAVARLRGMWRLHPSPGLVRYALRFIPEPVVREMAELSAIQRGVAETSAGLPRALTSVIQTSLEDLHSFRHTERPRLTQSEVEILRLMQLGHSNQAIAAERVVTMGTLRTQIKSLHRKLGSDNRDDAVALASDWGLLPGP